METALFTVQSTYTEAMIANLSDIVWKYGEIGRRSRLLITGMVVVLAVLLLLLTDKWWLLFAVLLGWLIGLRLSPKMFAKQAIKAYRSNKSVQNLPLRFDFYNDYFTQTSKKGVTKIFYHDLHQIVIVDQMAYLFLAINQAAVVPLADLTASEVAFFETLKQQAK
ncbi:YcxB family protein [Enterococcus diestrammenae]|uniref:YcxB-like protein domain-containing protein n=1 Tax=Enterococcus diestrammenae TaxID=1155073 RepID=A0ABV0F432_9ENTE|nr:YcxB family protein [Enterococcus diestrammenae]KAF1296281.1 hypothetical protein BAU18_06780 [Enterococcus diestrammenae]